MAQQFYFKKSNSPFKDLPAEKVIELTQAYQSGTTVKEIIKDIKGVTPQTFYRSEIRSQNLQNVRQMFVKAKNQPIKKALTTM